MKKGQDASKGFVTYISVLNGMSNKIVLVVSPEPKWNAQDNSKGCM